MADLNKIVDELIQIPLPEAKSDLREKPDSASQ